MTSLIGMKEMARSLGISQKALRIRVSKGKIDQPVKRVGDELFWSRGTDRIKPVGNLNPFTPLTPEIRQKMFSQDGDETNEQLLRTLRPNVGDYCPATSITKEVDVEILVHRNKPEGTPEMHILKSREGKGEYQLTEDSE